MSLENIQTQIEQIINQKRDYAIRNRYKDNLQIIDILKEYITENQDIRFIQALWNLGIINLIPKQDKPIIEDRFFEEPQETIEKINKRYNIKKEDKQCK